MKRNNKKGFTIVELVIVIAVIAILSAVLIPTFGGIVDKANASAAQQEAKNAHTQYLIDTDADTSDVVIVVEGKYYFTVTDGQLEVAETAPEYHTAVLKTYGDVTIHTPGKCVNTEDSDSTQDGVQVDTKCDDCGAEMN